MKPVGITLGEPCGIGPELVARTLASRPDDGTSFVLYGNSNLLQGGNFPSGRITWRPSGHFPLVTKEQRAESVLEALNAASKDALEGKISALVTAPIDKSVVRTILPSFLGHTEYLAEKAGIPKTLMLMDNGEIRVVLLTTHVALRDVPHLIAGNCLEDAVRITAKSWHDHGGTRPPRFALAALNPHAGETSENPEEDSIFKPALEKLRRDGIQIDGPLPADSLFATARAGKWDVIFSPYHDQGLVAVKYAGLDKVVNITLGLPYLRTSPGHGVAYDIVGTEQVDSRSFERALNIAVTGRWVEK